MFRNCHSLFLIRNVVFARMCIHTDSEILLFCVQKLAILQHVTKNDINDISSLQVCLK